MSINFAATKLSTPKTFIYISSDGFSVKLQN